MKKAIILIAVLAFAATAYAQYYKVRSPSVSNSWIVDGEVTVVVHIPERCPDSGIFEVEVAYFVEGREYTILLVGNWYGNARAASASASIDRHARILGAWVVRSSC